jgi:site-specific recombinase XerD
MSKVRVWIALVCTCDGGLSSATAHKRISNARQFFQDAVDRELIGRNPFRPIKSTAGSNRERDFFITRDLADKVLEECTDDQWRLLFALSRFGGLRCPSEHLALRLDGVDWERNRLRVDSPKTEHHDGKAFRMVPLFPELRPYVEQVFDSAPDGATHFITRYGSARQNLRTQLKRIIERAGLEAWPKLRHNLRASRQTELEEQFPSYVVCAWMGNG